MQELTGRLAGPLVSGWARIGQERVDRHAANTGDAQWIHNDPVRAAAEGPFGGPIAQGFLLLALFTEFAEQALPPADGLAYLVNYGFDRVRFRRPVRVGAEVRLRLRLHEARPKGPAAVLAFDATLEARDGEGEEPEAAVVARWLFLAAAS